MKHSPPPFYSTHTLSTRPFVPIRIPFPSFWIEGKGRYVEGVSLWSSCQSGSVDLCVLGGCPYQFGQLTTFSRRLHAELAMPSTGGVWPMATSSWSFGCSLQEKATGLHSSRLRTSIMGQGATLILMCPTALPGVVMSPAATEGERMF